MKIFLGSLILPIKDRRIKELSFGRAINQHRSANNNGKQPAAEDEARELGRGGSLWSRSPSTGGMLERGVQAPSQRAAAQPCRVALAGLGGCSPHSAPRCLHGAEYRRGGAKELGLVGTLNTDASLVCARPGLTRLGAARQPRRRVHQLFSSVAPAPEQTPLHPRAGGRRWWDARLYFSASAVCLRCFLRVWGKDTASVLVCEALKRLSTIAQCLPCSCWSLDPPNTSHERSQ